MIAIRLITLHMIIAKGSSACIAIDAGGRGKGARWTLCVVAKFGSKLVYAGEGTTKRGEIHHDTLASRRVGEKTTVKSGHQLITIYALCS